MELPITHPTFQRQKLSVRTTFLGGAALLLDGVELKRAKKEYRLRDDSGAEMVAKLKSNFIDPVPTLDLSGELVRIARPLTWYEYTWSALPIVLLFVGGGLGGLIGVIGAMLNARIIRSGRSVSARYGITAVSTLGAFVVFFFAALALQTVFGASTR